MKTNPMNIRLKNSVYLVAALMLSVQVNQLRAQTPQSRSQDSIATQVVNIVKPYTPKISDAFKMKQTPSLERTETTQKPVTYTIFSIPVASTFTPAKSNSVRLRLSKKEKLFQNYAILGLGNYGTALGNVFLNHKLGRGENLGASIEHYSSQGGIDGLQLDDDFSNSSVQVNYAKRLKTLVWNSDVSYKRLAVNWYGIPFEAIGSIDPKQVYSTIKLGSDIQFSDGVFQTAKLQLQRFSDAYDSQVYHLKAASTIQFNGLENPINTLLKIDYLKGEFSKSYATSQAQSYGNIQFSAAPSYQYLKDDLAISVGFKVYYLMDSEQNKTEFYAYPHIEARYAVVNSIVVAYAGIKGDLHQNTYHDFVQANPFVSPTLDIRPSSTPYNVFVGTKGKLSQTIGYDIHGSFAREQDKALFRTQLIKNYSTPNNYNRGNSFRVVYDDVDVFTVSGALEADMSQKLSVRLKGALYNYSSDLEPSVWNLPDFEASLFLEYQLSEKLMLVGSVFYLGSRQDTINMEDIFFSEFITSEVKLDAFIDANVQLDYDITNQFSAFVKVNNIANKSYNRWSNYPVQGLQILGGATYKFDF
jgi:hypothetical protein